jgi:aspartate ammonia-lyase
VAKGTERLRTVNLGGTAVGTGLTAPRDYIFQVIEDLRAVTGLNLARADHVMDATANADPLVEVAGMLSAHAANVGKLCRDLRLLHGLGDIRLSPVQAGSSIMPGKVNPVIPEAGIQASMRAHALLGLVGSSAAEGSLQINEFMPLIAEALLEACDVLDAADAALAPHVDAIEADPVRCRARLDACPALLTVLVPSLGYERAQSLAQDLAHSGRTDVRAFLGERLGADVVDRMLAPASVMALGYRREG